MGAGGVTGEGGFGCEGDGTFNIRELEGRSDELEGGRGKDAAPCVGGVGDWETKTCESEGRDFDRIWAGIVRRWAGEFDEGVRERVPRSE